MPTSLYNFQYVPLTGRLPGKSFVSQTEQAINGLAQYVYENSTNYEAVKAIAQKAEDDSSAALEYSEEALDKAQTALETVGRAYIKTTSVVDLNNYFDSELLYITNVESANLPADTTGYLTVMSTDSHDYCMQVYICDSGDVYKRSATIADSTPTFGSWSETPITMSVLQPLLNALANADASNIGINADTDNSIAWGTAIGGGEIANGEQKLITGGTVYSLSVDIGTADKRITNIEKLLQGNLYDYQTDSTSAYTKSVPSGAMPYAGVEKIGGKTVVWNQLVDSGTTAVNTISGHKYYTLIDGTASIITADGTAITIVDDTADMVFDLTLMFGSGNEPSTTADFTAIYPASYYPYNAGTLLSAGVTSVESVGSNIIDESKYKNALVNGTMSFYASGYNYDIFTGTIGAMATVPDVSKILRLEAGTYTLCSDNSTTRLYVMMIAPDGTLISASSIATMPLGANKSATFTLTQRTYITLRCGERYDITIQKLRLVYGSDVLPYAPYKVITTNIPAEIQALEGYGWSAGTAYNYVDFERKVFVQEVGSRAYASDDESDSAVITDGTTTYYPLNPAIETDISEYLTDDNLINVEIGGTLTFPNQNGDDYRLPVPSEETYMIDLQSAIGG